MRTSNYSVFNRKISFCDVANITGNKNVDTFHFDFDSEWDVFNYKYLVLFVGTKSYIDLLDSNNNVVLRSVAYDRDDVTFGVIGKNVPIEEGEIEEGEEIVPTSPTLSSNIVWLETIPSAFGQIKTVDGLPDKTVWELYTEEMLGLLAQGQINAENAQASADDANTAKEVAQESATAAATSESNAQGSATSASQSATSAQQSATSASESATSANTSKESAESSKNAAKTAEDNAKASENSAKSYKESAESSATSAQRSAESASSSATSAASAAGSASEAASLAVRTVNGALTNIENAETAAIRNVGTAETEALGNIESAEDEAIQNIQTQGLSYENRIQLLEDNFDTETSENSNNYIIDDSASGFNRGGIKIGDGEIKQIQSTGKNKISLVEALASKVTSTSIPYRDTNSVIAVGKSAWANVAYLYDNIKNEDITVSAYFKSVLNRRVALTVYGTNVLEYSTSDLTQLGTENIEITNNNPALLSVSCNSGNYDYIVIRFWVNSSASPLSDSKPTFIYDIQLEEGLVATTSEQYTNGEATPNPGYAQPIKVVEGENSIKLNNVNWFDLAYLNSSSSGIEITGLDDGEIRLNGTKVSGYFNISKYFSIPKGNYIFSVDRTIPYSLKFRYKYKDSTSILYGTSLGINAFNALLDVDAELDYVQFYMDTIEADTQVDFSFKIQIEKVEDGILTPSKYVPHKGQTYPITLPEGMFLGHIDPLPNTTPTGSNYIFGTKDNWKLHQGLIKAVLSSESNWTKSSNTTVDRFVWSGFRSVTGIVLPQLCNYLKKSAPGLVTPGAFKINDAQLLIDFTEYGTTTLEQFTTWLSQNSVEIYGEPGTTTDVDITDTTLIAQLNAIADGLQTYKDETIVFTSSDDGLAPNIQFNYAKNPISNMQEAITSMQAQILALAGGE